ncbi:MAG: radical SAM family heme chaperone HemW [bacterium]
MKNIIDRNSTTDNMIETSCYIHVPFCEHKCIYCDFYSIITSDNINSYLAAIKQEIRFYSARHKSNRIFKTIFFGGGTPSILKPSFIEEIINQISKNFYLADDAEITLETNPGTVDNAKLKSFKNTGINRISIGVQSFNPDELAFLTRIHDSQTAKDTVIAAYDAGISNINVDLIFNLPGQTKEKWIDNLSAAVKLPITHISAYSLILEKGTILNKMVLDGKVTIGDADYDADLYEDTIDFLASKGFEHYEVSNFCLPEKECLHNMFYWLGKDYLGFGPSAHSTIAGERWWNYSSLKMYISAIEKNGHAIASREVLSAEQKLQEYVMLNMRAKGINLGTFKNSYGIAWFHSNEKLIRELIATGYLELKNDFIKFTPKGYSVCDEILVRLK